jgi:uncharacterized repeat protein (TIGR02543 family)/LPXTG-motif cell wall-anchored protein
VASQTLTSGNKATAPAAPTKAGEAFAGWYSDAALTVPWDFDSSVNGNITLYAKWAPGVTVYFDSKGGSSVPSQVVQIGSPATKPTDPTRSQFDFAGWYTDEAYTTEWNFSNNVTGDMTLYAKWSDKPAPTPTPGGNTNSPKTGDLNGSVMLYVILASLASLGGAAVMVMRRRVIIAGNQIDAMEQ